MRSGRLIMLFCACCSAALAIAQITQTQPAAKDDAVDWLLGQAATQSSASAGHGDPAQTQPASPFADSGKILYRRGVITLSDGEKLRGPITTTLDKPLRVWIEEKGEYRDVPFALIRSMVSQIVYERDVAEWHFKESGSDIKEYSGKSYPARELLYVVTLLNGEKITGGVVAPLQLKGSEEEVTFVLHKRDKGKLGQTLKQLVYVERVDFNEPASDKDGAKDPTTAPVEKAS